MDDMPTPFADRRSGGLRRHLMAPFRKRETKLLLQLVPLAVEDVVSSSAGVFGRGWLSQSWGWTSTGSFVVMVGPEDGQPAAVMKFVKMSAGMMAERDGARLTIASQAEVGGYDVESLPRMVPTKIASSCISEYLCESTQYVPGVPLSSRLSDANGIGEYFPLIAQELELLHSSDRMSQEVDSNLIYRLIEAPADVVRRALRRRPGNARAMTALNDIVDELISSLQGLQLSLCRIHGDLWPGNVLVEVCPPRVMGFLDWDRSERETLPSFDLLHLVLFTRSLSQKREPGAVVRLLLKGDVLSEEERLIIDGVVSGPGDDRVPLRTLLLLYWLRQMSLEMRDFEAAGLHFDTLPARLLWERRNLWPVLSMN